MTDNVPDPSRCAPSAMAGLAQAVHIAPDIAAFRIDGDSGPGLLR